LSNIFILLSHERSGSHLVGEYMGSLQNFRMVDEVCNPNAVRPAMHPESFHRFKYEFVTRDPSFVMEPSAKRHAEFVSDFFEHLRKPREPNGIAVDIKYGHVQNFEWWWCPPLVRPFLLNFCQEHDFGIVHLFRENVVEATVSGMIADKRRIWHSWQSADNPAAEAPIALPVAEVIRRAQLLERQTNLFKGWTRNNRKLEITYEKISPLLDSGAKEDGGIGQFLGSSSKGFKLRHRKVTPPLQNAIENYEELRRGCEEAGLGWCLS